MLKLIQEWESGGKTYEYKGAQFSISPDKKIMWATDWRVADWLVIDGLAIRETFSTLYSHTQYTLK